MASFLSRRHARRTDSSASIQPGRGHLTWASATFSRTFQRTTTLLKRQFWLWPIAGVILLSVVALSVHSAIESTMRENLESELQTLLNIEVAMLETWLSSQESNVESLANQVEVRTLMRELLRVQGDALITETNEPAGDPVQLRRAFARLMAPSMNAHDYVGFMVLSHTGDVLAASESELIGKNELANHREWLTKVIDGRPIVSVPFASRAAVADGRGNTRTGVPTMFSAAPIRDDNFQVIGILAMRIRPEREFTRILQLGRIGESGETYAFDSNGNMISNSRFDEDLILLGLLPDKPDSNSLLNLQIRDPGVNMTRGERPEVRRNELPLTRMAESAIAGQSSIDVDGYSDYRGVPVVGAWRWLENYGFGVASETDVAEAYRPLTILKIVFWSMMGLLILCSIGLLIFAIVAAKLQRDARMAAIEAKQLGQYKLEEKLGEGAMGVVYRGQHAMLRRPTAIKLLDGDKVNSTTIARFEREVQTTSRLNHPNTIAIYDFGRTPEGVFYYAMEYLDGINLQHLVDQYGPMNPARTIYILKQICGSLFEAHSQGLVHRDVKPANVMLNHRGGEADVVKVLDFGLVKARDENAAGDDQLAGTPLYMSPEAIQMPGSVDPCSDLYAVGAVGYFMLTGRPVFQANSFAELCRKQVSETPKPPSTFNHEIPEDLETIILACLEKDRSRRPQTARDLGRQLTHCSAAAAWDSDAADRWWTRHTRGDGGIGSSIHGLGSSAAHPSHSTATPTNTLAATMQQDT